MYIKFFGLSEKPFSITPDPHFLFLSERHAEALAHLVYGVTESGGFIQLTGEVGTGKTTLTRCLLDRLPQTVDLAVVLNPRLTVHEFLLTIFDELHIEAPAQNPTNKELVDALNLHLLDSHTRGRRTVLLVDEAQNLDSDVLEQLRLLTNLETSKEKLLQIILVGQPELRETLARKDLRQLAQRITGRYHLENLSAEETIAYIRHRVSVAGGEHDIFESAALWEVHRLTGGIPRLINVICDRALLGAYTAESKTVTRKIVRAAAAEVHGKSVEARPQKKHYWSNLAMTAAVLLMLGVAGWGIAQLLGGSSRTMVPAPATAATGTEAVATAKKQPAALRLSMAHTLKMTRDGAAAPAFDSLTAILNDPASDTSTDSAFVELFKLWGRPTDFDRASPCRFALQQNLKCEFLVGSMRLINTLNRPAILSLVDDNGQLHNAVVTRVDGSAVEISVGGVKHTVSTTDIANYWYGELLILWQPRDGADSLLLPNTRSNAVASLRRSLDLVDGQVDNRADPRRYDADLERRVMQFQRRHHLEADGKAGVQTLIALNTALEVAGTPVLKDITRRK
ncbi:MAG: AAA family ATPase [Gammaproteobacteria bacterium]|nr:AAA family ATPase [Gammaproteobacteria bacterium]